MKKFRGVIYILLILLIGLIGLNLWTTIRQKSEEQAQNWAAYVDTLVRPVSSFPLNLKWKTELGSSTYEYPAYQNGLVLMPADEIAGGVTTGRWYGIDAQTGKVAWRQRKSSSHSFRRCLTEKYLVISGGRSFMAIDLTTGVHIWEKEKANTASCSHDAIFYSEVPRNTVSAADLLTGQDLWIGTEPRKSNFSSLVYNPEKEELLATHAEDFCAIDPQTGQLKHSFLKAGYGAGSGTGRGARYLIDRGELFVGANVLDAQTGEVIHREENYGSGLLPMITADTMYLAAVDDGVVALDRANYEVKWIYPSPIPKTGSNPVETISSVAILDDLGYIIFSDATLRVFDLETGQELGYWQPSKEDLMEWRICTYPNPRSDCIESARAGLATSEDTLFVSFGDGKLYAFGK